MDTPDADCAAARCEEAQRVAADRYREITAARAALAADAGMRAVPDLRARLLEMLDQTLAGLTASMAALDAAAEMHRQVRSILDGAEAREQGQVH